MVTPLHPAELDAQQEPLQTPGSTQRRGASVVLHNLSWIHLLDNGAYQESTTSLAFPQLPVQELPSLIEEYRPLGKRAMRRAFRQWVRNKLSR